MHRPLPPSLTSDFEAQSEPSGSRAFYKMLHLFVACPFFIPLFYYFIVHASHEQYHLIIYGQLCTCIYSAFLGESLRKIFHKGGSLILSSKKQPPDTFLISDSCFIIFHPAAFLLSRCLMSKLCPLCCAPPACMLF